MAQQIFIFGGGKGIGFWLATHFCAEAEVTVTVADTDTRALARLPGNLTPLQLDDPDSLREAAKMIPPGSWVLLATPMQTLGAVGESLGPYLRDVLIIETASVQVAGEQAVRPHVAPGCAYLGLHPLFGPAINSPVGQIVTLTGYKSGDKRQQRFRDFLQQLGINTTFATAQEHDDAMLYVQVLTHFTLLSFAHVLGTQQKTFCTLARFRTPPFQFLAAFAGRLLKSAPPTIMGIQAVERATAIRESLIAAATSLHNDMQAGREDPTALAAIFEKIRAPYSADEIEEAITVSSVATDSIQQFDTLLHSYQVSRRAFFARHRDDSRLIVGVIEEIDADEIVLRPSLVEVPTKNGKRSAVAFNATATHNYGKLGIAFPSRKRTAYKKRRLALLSEKEVEDWIAEHALYLTLQRGFANPRGYHAESIERIVPKFLPEVRECEYTNVYRVKGKMENVTLRLSIAPWASVPEVCANIESLLSRD